MTARISMTLLIALVLACTAAAPAGAAPSLDAVTGAVSNGGGGESTSGAETTARDTVGNARDDAGESVAAVTEKADPVNDTASKAADDTSDTVNTVIRDAGDTIVRDGADTVGRETAATVEDLAGTVDQTLAAGSNSARDTITDSGVDTLAVSALDQTSQEDDLAPTPVLGDATPPTPSLGDVGAPSPGAVDPLSSGIAEAGAVDGAVAGGESVPAAAVPVLRSSGSISAGSGGGPSAPAPLATPAEPQPVAGAPAQATGNSSAPSVAPKAFSMRNASAGAVNATRVDLDVVLGPGAGLAGLTAAGSSQGAPADASSLRQKTPNAPPAGASGMAGGISAAASSSLLLVLASVLVLWLAGPSFRLRPRIAAAPPVPFVPLLEQPG
jgi:hypothetical protein